MCLGVQYLQTWLLRLSTPLAACASEMDSHRGKLNCCISTLWDAPVKRQANLVAAYATICNPAASSDLWAATVIVKQQTMWLQRVFTVYNPSAGLSLCSVHRRCAAQHT
jgi:hypothetical protein